MGQKIEPLTDAEKGWIREQLEGAREFVVAFAIEEAEEALTLGALDRAFAAWLDTSPSDAAEINTAINHVSIAFGECLVQRLDLSWMIVSDDEGTELAVHGLPGRGDVLVFPQNFVAKRWERRETDFLVHSYHQIASHLESLRKTP